MILKREHLGNWGHDKGVQMTQEKKRKKTINLGRVQKGRGKKNLLGVHGYLSMLIS